MTRTRPNPLVALGVALPLAVLVFGAARSEYRVRHSEDWEFVVRGYDPRDLLRGHYIQYRIDFGETSGAGCSADDPDCCLCLTRESGVAPHRTSCTVARNECDGALQTRVMASLDRYYVPESRARDIERDLQAAGARGEARVVLAIDEMGRAHVKELRVDGRKLE